MDPKKPVKHDKVHAFSSMGRVRSQIKRLEIGNFVASTPFAHVYHGVKEPTENMIEFLGNFASEKMIIKCYEKIKIEWMFEDIKRASLATLEDDGEGGGGSLTWIRLELHQPPLWSQKKPGRENVRTVSAWEKPVRQHTPLTRWGEEVFQDVRKDPTFGVPADRADNGCVLHIAFHTLPVTWVRYFQFPIQAGRMKEYDESLRDELIGSLPPARRPFDAVWSDDLTDLQTCVNCDDGNTPCAVYCHACEQHLCKECDIVLHKSRVNCVHRRNCVLRVAEATIVARQACPPCKCERGAEQCPCAEAHVYCALQCRCSSVNRYNYRSQTDEINIEGDFFEYLRMPARLRGGGRKRPRKNAPEKPFDDASDFIDRRSPDQVDADADIMDDDNAPFMD